MNTAIRLLLAVCLGMLSMAVPATAAAKRSVIAVGLYPQQAEFASSTEFIRGFVGGRGSGKTRSGAYTVTRVAKHEDPWMCVSPDAGVVTETTLPTFLEVCESLGIYLEHKLSPYPRVKFATRDGGCAEIVFRSGEKPKKLHGPNKAGLWIDEASLQKKDVFLDAIPTLRWRGVMGPCLMTFTPKGKKNWTFETFFEEVQEHLIGTKAFPVDQIEFIAGRAYKKKVNTHLVHATSRDNPFLPEQFYDVLAGNMSRQLALQELEGNFIEIAGLMFNREWFELVDEAPRDALRVRYWDKAATPGSGCYTAGLLMAMDPRGIVYIEDVVRGQWSYRERDVVIEQVAEADSRKYQGEVIIVAEQEGGSGGKEVMHQMITNLGRFPVQRDIVSGKQSKKVDGIELPGQPKIVRAMPLSGQAEAGNVKLVRGRWNQDFLDELCSFPEATICDQVDAASGAFNRLKGKIHAPRKAATKDTVDGTTERFGALAALKRQRQSRRLFGLNEQQKG